MKWARTTKIYAFLCDFFMYQKGIHKKYLTWNGIYLRCMTFGVHLLERHFFLTWSSFYIWYKKQSLLWERKFFLTQNSIYVLCMIFRVLLSERKNSSFYFPTQYCVGIVENFSGLRSTQSL